MQQQKRQANARRNLSDVHKPRTMQQSTSDVENYDQYRLVDVSYHWLKTLARSTQPLAKGSFY